jgi:hypothetical protein
MWSDESFMQHAKDTLLCRRQTSFSKEPVLYFIGSYGVHITAFNEKRLYNHNIFIVIVSPNLTNIFQPLDGAINRSLQAFQSSFFDNYINNAISDVRMQTKAGNTKCHAYYYYLTVTTWFQKWIGRFSYVSIANDSLSVVWYQRLC